jgi:hypothetical protein
LNKPLHLRPDASAAPAQRAGLETTVTPADLAALVAAWPKLPESIRAGIVAMVRATQT